MPANQGPDSDPGAARRAWNVEQRSSGRRGQVRWALSRVRRNPSTIRDLPGALIGALHAPWVAAPAVDEVRRDVLLPRLSEVAEGPPRRSVRAAVLADAMVLESLRPEWVQTDLGSDLVLSGQPDLVLLQESALTGLDVAPFFNRCSALGVPVVRWIDGRQTVAAADLTSIQVHLDAWVQPRLHRPIRWGPGRAYAVSVDRDDPAAGPLVEGVTGLGVRVDDVGEVLGAQAAYRLHVHGGPVRRLLETAAAATPLISADVPGADVLGPGTVPVARTPDEAAAEALALLSDSDLSDRVGQLTHRLVLDHHTAAHRVDAVLDAAGVVSPRSDPSVSVVLSTNRPEQLDHVLATLARQTWSRMQLVLVLHGDFAGPAEVKGRAVELGLREVEVLTVSSARTLGAALNAGLDAADGDVVAKVDDDNLYAPAYLTDLVRALDWAQADVVGKWAHHVWLEGSGELLLRFAEHEHRYVRKVQGGSMLIRGDVARRLRFDDLPRAVDTAFLRRCERQGLQVYASDRWNFVSVRRADASTHTWTAEVDVLRASATLVARDVDPLDVVTV